MDRSEPPIASSGAQRVDQSALWPGTAVVSTVLFVATLAIVEGGSLGEDRSLDLAVHRVFGPQTYGFFTAVSIVGGGAVRVVLVILMTIALLKTRQWRSAAVLVIGVGGAALLDTVVKLAVRRPRPHLFPHAVYAGGYSFPSGHAMNTAALSLVAVYLLWYAMGSRYVTLAASALGASITILVGLSRVVLGVHYPSDVLGGFALGVGWVALVVAVLNRVSALRLRP